MKAITIDCSNIGIVELFKKLQMYKDDTCVVITDIGTFNHIAVIKAALDGRLMMRTNGMEEEFEFTSTIIITSETMPGSLHMRMWKAGKVWVGLGK